MIDDEMELILLNDMANDDREFITDEPSGCGGILIVFIVILAIMVLIGIIL